MCHTLVFRNSVDKPFKNQFEVLRVALCVKSSQHFLTQIPVPQSKLCYRNTDQHVRQIKNYEIGIKINAI